MRPANLLSPLFLEGPECGDFREMKEPEKPPVLRQVVNSS